MIMNTRVVHINIIGKEMIHFIFIDIINNDTQFSQNGVYMQMKGSVLGCYGALTYQSVTGFGLNNDSTPKFRLP